MRSRVKFQDAAAAFPRQSTLEVVEVVLTAAGFSIPDVSESGSFSGRALFDQCLRPEAAVSDSPSLLGQILSL